MNKSGIELLKNLATSTKSGKATKTPLEKKQQKVIARRLEKIDTHQRSWVDKKQELHTETIVGSDVIVDIIEDQQAPIRTHVSICHETRSKQNVGASMPYENCFKHIREKREMAELFFSIRNNLSENKKALFTEMLAENNLDWNLRPIKKNADESVETTGNNHASGTL